MLGFLLVDEATFRVDEAAAAKQLGEAGQPVLAAAIGRARRARRTGRRAAIEEALQGRARRGSRASSRATRSGRCGWRSPAAPCRRRCSSRWSCSAASGRWPDCAPRCRDRGFVIERWRDRGGLLRRRRHPRRLRPGGQGGVPRRVRRRRRLRAVAGGLRPALRPVRPRRGAISSRCARSARPTSCAGAGRDRRPRDVRRDRGAPVRAGRPVTTGCSTTCCPACRRCATGELRLGLITNNEPVHQRGKLAQVGLSDGFDVVVISGEVGVAKPDPAIFEYACSALGVAAAAGAARGGPARPRCARRRTPPG